MGAEQSRKRKFEEAETEAEEVAGRLRALRSSFPKSVRRELEAQEEEVEAERADVAATRYGEFGASYGPGDAQAAGADVQRVLETTASKSVYSVIKAFAADDRDMVAELATSDPITELAVAVKRSRMGETMPDETAPPTVYYDVHAFDKAYAIRDAEKMKQALIAPRVQRSKLNVDALTQTGIRRLAAQLLHYVPCGVNVAPDYSLDKGATFRTPAQVKTILKYSSSRRLLEYIVESLSHMRACSTVQLRPEDVVLTSPMTQPVIAVVVIHMHGYVPFAPGSSARFQTFRVPPNVAVSRASQFERSINLGDRASKYALKVSSEIERYMQRPLSLDPLTIDTQVASILEKLHRDKVSEVASAVRMQLVASKPENATRNLPRSASTTSDLMMPLLFAPLPPQMKHFLPGERMINKIYSIDTDRPMFLNVMFRNLPTINLLTENFAGAAPALPQFATGECSLETVVNTLASVHGVAHIVIADLSCQDFEHQNLGALVAVKPLLGGTRLSSRARARP